MCIDENGSVRTGNGCYNSSKRKVNYMLLSYVFKVTDDCRIEVVVLLPSIHK